MRPLMWFKTLFAVVRYHAVEQREVRDAVAQVDDLEQQVRELAKLIRSRT